MRRRDCSIIGVHWDIFCSLVLECLLLGMHTFEEDDFMSVKKIKQDFTRMQDIFRVAGYLQLTSHLWPKTENVQDDDVYDYIIVGAGTAGCVIATRLIEISNVSVLLIEAGGNPPWESAIPKHFPYLKSTAVDWNLTSIREKTMLNHQGGCVDIPQGKMLGGTSSLNYMIYEHGNPVEYSTWSTLVNSTKWLYDEVLPHYMKNEKLLDRTTLASKEDRRLYGTKGQIKLNRCYVQDIQRHLLAFEELGIKRVVNLNSKNPVGVCRALFNTGKRSRQSTAYSLLRRVRNHPRLHVMTHALVTEVIFDSRKTAIGVKITTEDNEHISVMANIEVILSAGVFKTPQLLMLSGIGPRDHLISKNISVRVNLPVGENLQDSPAVPSVFKISKMKASLIRPSDSQWIGFSVINSAIAVHRHDSFPDYMVRGYIFEDAHLFLTLCAIYLTYSKQVCETIFKNIGGKQIMATFNSLAYPLSRGKVYLKTKNILDGPLIQLGLYAEKHDLNSHAAYLTHFHTILNTSHFEKLGAQFIDPQLKNCKKTNLTSLDFWKCYALAMATTSNNHFGTCAMGTIVDTNLFVKGVKKLRVVDASVIPTTLTSPIQAAVIMIAEKAADMIKKDFYTFRNPNNYM